MSKKQQATPSASLSCQKCGSEHFSKNGMVRSHQRYRCKIWGYNFTDTPPRGYPLEQKVRAVMLYLRAYPSRAISAQKRLENQCLSSAAPAYWDRLLVVSR